MRANSDPKSEPGNWLPYPHPGPSQGLSQQFGDVCGHWDGFQPDSQPTTGNVLAFGTAIHRTAARLGGNQAKWPHEHSHDARACRVIVELPAGLGQPERQERGTDPRVDLARPAARPTSGANSSAKSRGPIRWTWFEAILGIPRHCRRRRHPSLSGCSLYQQAPILLILPGGPTDS